ncbi:hypothetical protein AB9C21_03430 [Klebsiella michiganensis]|jgi:hypothetical protein|uniref:hypothetical protein n=1 Tax=Klebsiella michiganensis TaxID=1134687 RepID=UPI0012B821FD|nr:hypothetical protein [Klebsiella michiganensis]HBU6376168.1 hypothetical protein [Klebsiella variicola]
MKPGKLKPGCRVLIKPEFKGGFLRHGTFIRRVQRTAYESAYSVIRVDEYVGLNGPDDKGDAHFPDYDVSRRVSLLEGC